MSKQLSIRSVDDMLELSPDEFQRMLPDLALWYAVMKPIHGTPGVESTGFVWTDDGDNTITAVRMTDPNTGEVLEVKL